MKIAIPTAQGKLAIHFGHCETFTLIDVDQGTICNTEEVPAPAHEPGLLPRWLGEKGVNLIIAGGMGQRAQQLFSNQNIKLVIGAPTEEAKTLVNNYLSGTLSTGINLCDH